MTQEKKSVIIQALIHNCQKPVQNKPQIQNKPVSLSKNEIASKMSEVLKINFQAYSRWILYIMLQNQDFQAQHKSKYEESTPVIIQIDSSPGKAPENKIIQKQSVVESNKIKKVIEKQRQIKQKSTISSSQKTLKKHHKPQQKNKFIKKQAKQKLVRKVSETSISKPAKPKSKQTQIRIDLVDWIHIKNDFMRQNEKAQKKQNLLKRTVLDWNYIDKNRSERRELRMLKN